MTNQEVLKIAMEQSATDMNCDPGDFLLEENRVVLSKNSEKARKYLELPFLCDLVSYGNNLVASVSEEYWAIAEDYINRFPVEHCFETPNLHILMDRLRPLDANVCFMAEYWLPDLNRLFLPLSCDYETRILHKEDFSELYLPEWSNALCAKRKHLDVLGVGAYDCGRLVGLAACSADCDGMWQIGVDVFPEYRRQGIASALTKRLACEILEQRKLPFYCCAWANLKSARNAFRSGFSPAWTELTVKNNAFIEEMVGNMVEE